MTIPPVIAPRSCSQKAAFSVCISSTVLAALAGIALVAVQFIRIHSGGQALSLGALKNGVLNTVCASYLGGSLLISLGSGFLYLKMERKRIPKTPLQESHRDPQLRTSLPSSNSSEEDELFVDAVSTDANSLEEEEPFADAVSTVSSDDEYHDCETSDSDQENTPLEDLKIQVFLNPIRKSSLRELLKFGNSIEEVQKLYLENFLNPRIQALEEFFLEYLRVYKAIKPEDKRGYHEALASNIRKLAQSFSKKSLETTTKLEATLKRFEQPDQNILEEITKQIPSDTSPLLKNFMDAVGLTEKANNEFFHDLTLVIEKRNSEQFPLSLGELPAYFQPSDNTFLNNELRYFLSLVENWGLSEEDRTKKIENEQQLKEAIQNAINQYPNQAVHFLNTQLVEQSKTLEEAIFIPISMVSYLCKYTKYSIESVNQKLPDLSVLQAMFNLKGTLFQKGLDALSEGSLLLSKINNKLANQSREAIFVGLKNELDQLCPQYMNSSIHQNYEDLFTGLTIPVAYFLYGNTTFKLSKDFKNKTLHDLSDEQKQRVFGTTDTAEILAANGFKKDAINAHLSDFEEAYELTEINDLARLCRQVVLDPSNRNTSLFEITKTITTNLKGFQNEHLPSC